MSAEEETKMSGMMSRCASCGVKGGDDIKLKDCGACRCVRYCGVKCQRRHWAKHKQDCKKRVAELHDESLFRQPESNHFGDCPICFLPLSDEGGSILLTCCSKIICKGCIYANTIREYEDKLDHKCPFCRRLATESSEERQQWQLDRAEVNDPVAMFFVGIKCYRSGDHQSVFEYFSKAAKLGHGLAHFYLAGIYQNGSLGKAKSKELSRYHLEQAAIAGHPGARYDLAAIEKENEKYDRSVKHLMIAAKLGHYDSVKALEVLYEKGLVSKDDLDAAVHGHQAAINAMKSPQREVAEAMMGV